MRDRATGSSACPARSRCSRHRDLRDLPVHIDRELDRDAGVRRAARSGCRSGCGPIGPGSPPSSCGGRRRSCSTWRYRRSGRCCSSQTGCPRRWRAGCGSARGLTGARLLGVDRRFGGVWAPSTRGASLAPSTLSGSGFVTSGPCRCCSRSRPRRPSSSQSRQADPGPAWAPSAPSSAAPRSGRRGTESCGLVSCPLTVLVRLDVLLPVQLRLVVVLVGLGLLLGKHLVLRAEIVRLVRDLVGRVGIRLDVLVRRRRLRGRLHELVRRDLDVELSRRGMLPRNVAGRRPSASRYGTTANRIRWTKSTAASPTTMERDSGSAQNARHEPPQGGEGVEAVSVCVIGAVRSGKEDCIQAL